MEELDRTKEQKKKEWLNKIVNEQQASKKEQSKDIKPEDQEVEERDSQKSEVDLEEILLDEKKTTEIFNEIVKKDIKENIEQ